jgi:hypothetical protein
MDKAFLYDAVGKHIKGKLLLSIQVRGPRHTKVTGSDGVNNILSRLSDLADEVDQIIAYILLPQMTTQVNLEFRHTGFMRHWISSVKTGVYGPESVTD